MTGECICGRLEVDHHDTVDIRRRMYAPGYRCECPGYQEADGG